MEMFEEVDYSNYFITNNTFGSKEELILWTRSTARSHNMFLIVQTTRKRKVFLSCERYGKYRTTKINVDVENPKFTGSKKCQCPFMLKGWEYAPDMWRLDVMNGKHNHRPAVYQYGHALVSRLTQEQYNTTSRLTKSHVKPKEILDHLKREDPNIRTTLKHIYNARNKIKSEAMGGRTVMQQLMHYIDQYGYFIWHRLDEATSQLSDLMFCHPRSLQMLRLFPYVLLMDSTYKTNRYYKVVFKLF